jgi:hypothetical protein
MAKNLTFIIDGKNFEAAPVKIERKKLYGWTETKAFDDYGNECFAAAIDEGGNFIIPKGGTSLGALDEKGCWVDKANLKTVLVETGKPATLVPSSYDEPIRLDTEVSAEEFLDHEISSFYQLTGTDSDFAKALKDKIFTFVYNLRADYEGSPAFILAQDSAVYMFTGYKSNFEFLSLEQAGVLDAEDEEEEENEEIDFSFM